MAERRAKRKRTERREVARRILAMDPDASADQLMREMQRRGVEISRSYAYQVLDELRAEAAAAEQKAARHEARSPHARLIESELWRYRVPPAVAVILALALDGARWNGDPRTETPPDGVIPPPEGEDFDGRNAFSDALMEFLDDYVEGDVDLSATARCELRIPLDVPRRELLPNFLACIAHPVGDALQEELAEQEQAPPGWHEGWDEVIEPHTPGSED